MEPADKKSRALIKAWVVRCNMAASLSPRPKAKNISPSWLMVEKAIIFFMSVWDVGDRFIIDGFLNLLNFLYFRVVKFLWMKLDIMPSNLLHSKGPYQLPQSPYG